MFMEIFRFDCRQCCSIYQCLIKLFQLLDSFLYFWLYFVLWTFVCSWWSVFIVHNFHHSQLRLFNFINCEFSLKTHVFLSLFMSFDVFLINARQNLIDFVLLNNKSALIRYSRLFIQKTNFRHLLSIFSTASNILKRILKYPPFYSLRCLFCVHDLIYSQIVSRPYYFAS